MNLSKEIKLVRCAGYHDTEETHTVTGADVDFSNYDGVLFFGYVAKKTNSTDLNELVIYQKDSLGSYTALTGAVAIAVDDAEVIAVDVYRPLESQGKVLRAILEIATASKTGDLYALLYNGRIKPEEFADVVTLAISPATV